MLEGLTGSDTIIWIVYQQFSNQIFDLFTRVRNQFHNSCTFGLSKIQFHVSCKLLELLKQLWVWRSKDVVNFVDLIKFVIAREQWKQRNNFKQNTAYPPQVHFVAIIAICE